MSDVDMLALLLKLRSAGLDVLRICVWLAFAAGLFNLWVVCGFLLGAGFMAGVIAYGCHRLATTTDVTR